MSQHSGAPPKSGLQVIEIPGDDSDDDDQEVNDGNTNKAVGSVSQPSAREYTKEHSYRHVRECGCLDGCFGDCACTRKGVSCDSKCACRSSASGCHSTFRNLKELIGQKDRECGCFKWSSDRRNGASACFASYVKRTGNTNEEYLWARHIELSDTSVIDPLLRVLLPRLNDPGNDSARERGSIERSTVLSYGLGGRHDSFGYWRRMTTPWLVMFAGRSVGTAGSGRSRSSTVRRVTAALTDSCSMPARVEGF